MSDLIQIKVSKEHLKDAFAERVWYWEGQFCDRFLTALCGFFADAIDEGVYNDAEVNIEKIVDNAIVNELDFAEENGVIRLIDAVSGEAVYEMDTKEVHFE